MPPSVHSLGWLTRKEAVQRAKTARSRVPHKVTIRTGDVVYVWRNKLRSKTKGWIGPGLVVCVQDTSDSIWVSMRGVLVKCNRDRVRMATDSEWLGAELIKLLSADAKEHLERNGQRGFVDVTAEPGPEQDDEPPGSPVIDFLPT